MAKPFTAADIFTGSAVQPPEDKTSAKYLAQRNMRGLADAFLGLPDLINTGINYGIADVASLFGKTDPYQLPMASQSAANLAAEVTGSDIIPASAVSPEVQQKGANQQALYGMLPNDPGDLATLFSKAAITAPGTWWHGVSDVKLQKPLENMRKNLRPSGPMQEKKLILPEQFKIGDRLLMFPGDRSAAGKQLLGIGDLDFPTPVNLEGGGEYMFGPHSIANQTVWASHRPVMEGHAGRIREGAKGGGDVHAGYVPMAHPATNFSQQTTNAVKQAIQAKLNRGDITQAQVDEFDNMVRGSIGKEGTADYIGPSPEWPGILNATQEEIEAHGPTRLKVGRHADTKRFGHLVDMGELRNAVNSGDLRDTPSYNFGFSFAKMDPEGRFAENPALRHPDYNTQGLGEYEGGWDYMAPLDTVMRDWAASTAEKKGMPLSEMNPARLQRSAYMQNPTQIIDQEWIDTQMKLREAILRDGQ